MDSINNTICICHYCDNCSYHSQEDLKMHLLSKHPKEVEDMQKKHKSTLTAAAGMIAAFSCKHITED